MKRILLCLCLVFIASQASAKPEIAPASIAAAQDAAYSILEDGSVGDQCARLVHSASKPDVYVLRGAWSTGSGADVCGYVSSDAVFLKKGEAHVFCAPKCPEIYGVDGLARFSGRVAPAGRQ